MRTKPLTGRFSSHPCKSWILYVEDPNFAAIRNGLTQRCWNLVCLPLSSCRWSHLRTKSPTSKLLFPDLHLSNHLFTISCLCLNISLALSLDSSNLRKVLILTCKTSLLDPLEAWANWESGSKMFGGKMASFPYTRV